MTMPGSLPEPDAQAGGALPPQAAPAPGPLSRLPAQLMELLQTRLELLSTELEAEKLRLFGALVQMLLALLLAGGALFMASLAVLMFCPEAWRGWAALGLMSAYALLAAWAWRGARAQLSRPSGVFDASLAELARDRASLGG